MRRRSAYAAVAAAAVLPRLAVVLFERGDILAAFTEKSDDFARTFVESGTYGFIPGVPSAYTQPLYGFFLIPVYELAGRSWLSVGLAQIALAVTTALLVYEIGRRWLSPQAGLVAAIVTTLNPYLVWHDVHVNREIVDQLVSAALVLLVLAAAERRSVPLAAGAGAVAGVAILGNARLVLLPLALVAFLAWRLGRTRTLALASLALVAATALVLAPWLVRNRANVGCFAITTDARALWKANNTQTDELLASGQWIDAVRPIPGAPPTPEEAGALYRAHGVVVPLDECEQMRFYQRRVLEFWREHPGEKGELAARGAAMLWDPRVTRTETNPGEGTWLDTARTWPAGLYTTVVFVLALVALWLRRVPAPLAVLAVALLAYQTVFAMLFVGATRYRVAWDFLLVLLAAAGALAVAERRARRVVPA